MPALVPEFEYDIFISYRHNDNRSGWVTEFIKSLNEELSATIKEPLSVYFDNNSHDGLLETHNVDKSLEGKLKCLIFIPVLSQTYCDPKSFAWQHEFRAFNKLAMADSLGRDIKLSNGNVSSRILPIKIHDLDIDDKTIIEKEIGGVLRAIEFIYKEPGVNRPLKPTDNKTENQNKTEFGNQVNKVANAVKELIHAIKFPSSHTAAMPGQQPITEAEPSPRSEKKFSLTRRNIRVIIVLVVIGAYWLTKNLVESKEVDKVIDKSIAVLPFEDLSPAHDQEYFSDGIAEEILNSLAHIKELKVAGRTSSFQFKGQKTDLKDVGEKLNVGTVLEGSVRKMGNRVRITAQLINVKDGYHLWSETYDRDMTDVFAIQDEVAKGIAAVMLKELTVNIAVKNKDTENPKAYEYYLEGKYINIHRFAGEGKVEDFERAERLFKQALALDSNYALAHAGLADLYNTYTFTVKRDPHYLELQKKEIQKAYQLDPDNDYVNNAMGQVQTIMGEYEKAHESFLKALELNPNDGNNLFSLASSFLRMGLLEEAVAVTNESIRVDPLEPNNYFIRGLSYFQMARFDESMKDFSEATRLQPSNLGGEVFMIYNHIIKNQMGEAKKYIEKVEAMSPKFSELTKAKAIYEARLGNKEKALALNKDFRVYLILGMKEEAITDILKTFSDIKPPLNFYLSLVKPPFMSHIGDDPRIIALLEKQKLQYEQNKQRFKLPLRLLSR